MSAFTESVLGKPSVNPPESAQGMYGEGVNAIKKMAASKRHQYLADKTASQQTSTARKQEAPEMGM